MARLLHKAGIADALVVAESLAGCPQVREIILFGSIAQTNSLFGNDVDLMVVVDDSLTTKPVRTAETLPRMGMLGPGFPDVLLDLFFVPQSLVDEPRYTDRLLGLPLGFMAGAFAYGRRYEPKSHSFPGRR